MRPLVSLLIALANLGITTADEFESISWPNLAEEECKAISLALRRAANKTFSHKMPLTDQGAIGRKQHQKRKDS